MKEADRHRKRQEITNGSIFPGNINNPLWLSQKPWKEIHGSFDVTWRVKVLLKSCNTNAVFSQCIRITNMGYLELITFKSDDNRKCTMINTHFLRTKLAAMWFSRIGFRLLPSILPGALDFYAFHKLFTWNYWPWLLCSRELHNIHKSVRHAAQHEMLRFFIGFGCFISMFK